MRFVASLTRGSSELNTMLRLWQESGDPRNPFESVLITPLFMPPTGMKVIRSWKEQGLIKNLYFDSAGYYVQMGRIQYDELYYPLLECYRKERWADYYVLPDHVPTNSDSEEDVWSKVKQTVAMSSSFYYEMPDELKALTIPVIHGYSYEQVMHCLEGHLELNPAYLGFGSFDTSGKKSSINRLSSMSYNNLKSITALLQDKLIRLHAFGVSTPPVLHLLSEINIFSFDSVGWMKTAGFGKVILPYVRAHNITYGDKSAKTLKESEFQYMKQETHHDCYFCQSFSTLHRSRYHRILHNISVLLDMFAGQPLAIDAAMMIHKYSPQYSHLMETSS